MKKDKVIRKAYKVLENVTPLKYDCGGLCGCECCKGDTQTGMILFPGEEELLKESACFKLSKTSDGKHFAVCSGNCDRKHRPISCRIFPLFPVLEENKIYVLDDPRAAGICPLARGEKIIDNKFVNAVYKSGKILSKNEETCAVLKNLTDEIREVLTLRQMLFEKGDI